MKTSLYFIILYRYDDMNTNCVFCSLHEFVHVDVVVDVFVVVVVVHRVCAAFFLSIYMQITKFTYNTSHIYTQTLTQTHTHTKSIHHLLAAELLIIIK